MGVFGSRVSTVVDVVVGVDVVGVSFFFFLAVGKPVLFAFLLRFFSFSDFST